MAGRKLTVSMLALVVAGASLWLFRAEILLAVLSWRSAATPVAGTRLPDWQTAPAGLVRSEDKRPNIVLIVLDDVGINDLSLFGGGVADGRVTTPGIDRLAREGVLFRQAYAGSATCAPSRAMLMTGRYPTRTGFEFTPMPGGMGRALSLIADNEERGLPPLLYDADVAATLPDFEDMGLPADEVTLAEVLREAGYYTAHIGKWHLGRSEGSRPTDQGFDDSLLMASGLYLPEKHPDVVNARVDTDPVDRFLWARMRHANSFNGGGWFAPGGYLTDYWTDEALRVIERNRDRPFFLYLAHWGTHSPLQATRWDYEAVGDIQPHRLRVYAAMVRALDRSVERLLAGLAVRGLDENTLVMLTSDNGAPGYIGLPALNAPYRGWKMTLYEGGLRVPLVMRWPAGIAAGRSLEHPVAHIDVMPTLAAAAGTAPPLDREVDGRNLLPLAAGDSDTPPHDTLFWHSDHYQAVRAGRWKLQRSEQPAFSRLFDLEQDPTERRDLSAQRPATAARLRALLDVHLDGRRPPLYPSSLQGPVAVDKTLEATLQSGDTWIYWPN
jgi:uncharacterized sulfatase